jgi:hypothetical protein
VVSPHSRQDGVLIFSQVKKPKIKPTDVIKDILIEGGYTMRNIKLIIICLILLISVYPLFAGENNTCLKQSLAQYEEQQYIESIKTLEGCHDISEDGYYSIWLNEMIIGEKADLSSREENNKNQLFFQYVKDNPDHFQYYEPDGSYKVSKKRFKELLGQIKNLNPKSKLASKMLYHQADEMYDAYAEDGDMSKQQIEEILKAYRKSLNDADDKDKEEINSKITNLENL